MREKTIAVLLAVMMLSNGIGAQTALPVPGVEAMHDLLGAKELPNPAVTYKFVFDLTSVSPSRDEVNPGLVAVARMVNTFAKYGVNAQHRRFVVVFHDSAAELTVNESTYKRRNADHANPNAAIMRALTKAGVHLVVGGESVLARNVDPKTIEPSVQLNLSTTLTFLNLENQGYVFSSTGKL